jgi:hypothetical protein
VDRFADHVKAKAPHVLRDVQGDRLWLRNPFLVVLGLHAMWRAGELGALRVRRVFVCFLETDQAGHGFKVFIEPVEALWSIVRLWRQFVTMRGSRPGPLFMVAAVGLQATVYSHLLWI